MYLMRNPGSNARTVISSLLEGAVAAVDPGGFLGKAGRETQREEKACKTTK